MPIEPNEARRRVVEIFRVAPLTELTVDHVNGFVFPKLTGRQDMASGSDAKPDYSRSRLRKNGGQQGPIEQLRDAVHSAAEKLRFGQTTLREWSELVLFSGDRLYRKRPHSKIRSSEKFWNSSAPINQSKEVFEDWFLGYFLNTIISGGGERHSQAITGGAGSGKSTLIKFAMSQYASELDYQNIVLSRFEFLKFLEWHDDEEDISRALRNYLSFIHTRDLVLAHFFQFEDGCAFKMRAQFLNDSTLVDEIRILSNEIYLKAASFGFAHERERLQFLLSEAVSKACQSNHALIDFIRKMDFRERALLMFGLWQEKTVVTVFDGLDALNVEDAFQDTREWKAIKHIVSMRKGLCRPTLFAEQGIAVKADSLIIMRKNTLALLKSKLREEQIKLNISRVHQVENVNAQTAIVAIANRACRYIPSLNDVDDKIRAEFVVNVVTLVQRTLLAISRGHGPRVGSSLVFGVFDGNLRDLFRFVSRVIHHSINDMLSMSLLPREAIFRDVATLAKMAVDVGNQYLTSKSYQIVEIFLYNGTRFENALLSAGSKSAEFSSGATGPTVHRNEAFSGWVDNLFSYHITGSVAKLDDHPLIEKIRVLQSLRDGSKTGEELRSDPAFPK